MIAFKPCHERRAGAVAVSLLALAGAAFGGAFDGAWIRGVTDKSPVSYRCGEEMVFTLTLEGVTNAPPKDAAFDWKRSDDFGAVETGRVALADLPFVYRAKLAKPGFVRLEAQVVGKDGKRIAKNAFFDGGAGAEIEKLHAVDEPKDFDSFWNLQFRRLDNVPAKAELVEIACTNPKARKWAVRVDCAGLRPVTGYLTVPKAVETGTTFPARLTTHGYSGDGCRHGHDGSAVDDEIRFDINAHGLKLEEFGATEADRKALRWEVRSHDCQYAFDRKQNEDPETAYFNGMVLRVKRALQYLKTVKGWNGRDLIASGGSQGGLQTIWAAGCGEGVTRAESCITWCCDMAMNDVRLADKAATSGWYIPWTPALGYYDAVNFGKRIPASCRTVVTRAGLGDYICPPRGLAALWNGMTCPREIHWMQGAQHGYVPPDYAGRDFVLEAEPPVTVVDVDCGRQLFVDDFVVGSMTNVVRHWNAPTKLEDPIITPTSEKGGRKAWCTVATDGGLWWDPKIGKYRLWYETDWCGDLRYAESADGLNWEFPDLGVVKGSNQLFKEDSIDTYTVFPDYTKDDPYSQWNLFISDEGCHSAADTLFTSTDGKHFKELGVVGFSGDRTSMYYDPFRKKWVWSLRCYWDGRSRRYADSDTFAIRRPGYSASDMPKWTEIPSGNLYSFTAVPYESLMVGAMELLGDIPWMKHGRGDNGGCADEGLPKQTRIQFSFSRDGRRYAQGGEACALKPSGWGSGKWDTGYLSAAGGLFVIRDEKLWIYYSALRGDATRNEDTGYPDGNDNGMYVNGSIGAATLRRDGFAGLVADGAGTVETKPLKFTGGHLFVNAECRFGTVAAEVVGADGKVVSGFAASDCTALRHADTTKRELKFKGGSLASLGGKKVSIRFKLTTATLYSFWLSPSERGESRGWVAAGGPAYPGLRDL